MQDIQPGQAQQAPQEVHTQPAVPEANTLSTQSPDISTVDTQSIEQQTASTDPDHTLAETPTILNVQDNAPEAAPFRDPFADTPIPGSPPFRDPFADTPVPGSPPKEAAVKSGPAVWPPAPGTYRIRRAGLSTPMAALIFGLAFLLIAGGLGLIAFSETSQYQTSQVHLATTQAQQTMSVASTAQAHSQGTANALSTAQSNIEASATAQANANLDSGTIDSGATATAVALGDLYTQATNGSAVLDDPLSDDTGSGKWDSGANATNTGCTFTNNQYHASESQQGKLQPCIAQATNFASFAYQVHVTINNGGQGEAGLIFRSQSGNSSYYFFAIDPNGGYRLDLYTANNQATNLLQGTSTTVNSGLAQDNLLTVIANSASLTLYINGQYVDAITDTTLSAGKIGVGVVDQNTPVDATFSEAQVWLLSNSAQPTPTPTTAP